MQRYIKKMRKTSISMNIFHISVYLFLYECNSFTNSYYKYNDIT